MPISPPAARAIDLAEGWPAADVLDRARSGDALARETLIRWAYATASSYYMGRVRLEYGLTHRDAEDLAGAFVVEFNRAWPRISLLCHYTRRMLRNNLNRYLRRKREREDRELPLGSWPGWNRVAEAPAPWSDPTGDGRSDDDHRREAAVRRVLSGVDPVTRELMLMRASDYELTYRQIAAMLEVSESALRMRATRFYRLVREEYDRLGRRGNGSEPEVGTVPAPA